MAIQTFVTSRLDYCNAATLQRCNAALLGLSSASIDRVQHVMNSADRLLLPKFSHIAARMKDELHWLPVSLRIQFKSHFHDVEVYRWVRAGLSARSLPPTLHNLRPSETRSSVASRFLLDVPRARAVTMQKKASAYAGPTLWNNMPEAIRSSALLVSPDTIKKQLKTLLFSQF